MTGPLLLSSCVPWQRCHKPCEIKMLMLSMITSYYWETFWNKDTQLNIKNVIECRLGVSFHLFLHLQECSILVYVLPPMMSKRLCPTSVWPFTSTVVVDSVLLRRFRPTSLVTFWNVFDLRVVYWTPTTMTLSTTCLQDVSEDLNSNKEFRNFYFHSTVL